MILYMLEKLVVNLTEEFYEDFLSWHALSQITLRLLMCVKGLGYSYLKQ